MATFQVKFSRVNPQTPVHLVADDELVTATNIDFSLGEGALMTRRGSLIYGVIGGISRVQQIFRNYNVPDNISACPVYALTSFSGINAVYRGTGVGVWTPIVSGLGNFSIGMNSYQQYTLLAGPGQTFKDDGTVTTEWIKQAPATPVITINTLTPLDLTQSGSGTYSITVGTGSIASGTVTATADADNRIEITLLFNSPPFDLTTNGTNTIGNLGIHFVDMAFSDPTSITRVSQDYSIGNTNFYNYWHAEISPQNGLVVVHDPSSPFSAAPDPNVLIDAQLNQGTLTNSALSANDRANMIAALRDNTQPVLSGLTRLSDVFSPWGVARTEFGLVGPYQPVAGVDPWSQVYALRWTLEAAGTCTMTLRAPTINGAQNFPLNDVNVGYTYWQTFATLDTNGNKIGEGATSPPTAPIRMQQANATVTLGGTATNWPTNGINAVITYRQGGYTRTGYAINTATYSNAVTTITDTLNDIQALSLNFPIVTNLIKQGDPGLAISCISEPFAERVFYGEQNNIHWSLPGIIDSFPNDSYTRVGPFGDNVKSLVVWPPGLIIVNQNSVYELIGSDFETPGAYTLSRSAARKGSISPKTTIKTPFGIPLLSYDGLSMYMPGQGVDVELTWLVEGYGDMFKGGNPNDPAARKGNRIPAINWGQIITACAAYGQGKLYLAAATGTNATPQTLYVIDLISKRCWWYNYPFQIYSLLWDYQNNQLIAGSDLGTMLVLEVSTSDWHLLNGLAIPITWSATSKTWSVPSDSIIENLSIESEGNSIKVAPTLDGTANTTNTLTNTSRLWQTLPVNGSFSNRISLGMVGTMDPNSPINALYQLSFDTINEPVKVRYYRTPYDEKNAESDKLWDVAYHDINILEVGTISAVTFVDNTAVMTNLLVGPTGPTPEQGTGSGGRTVQMVSFPPETYGRIAYTTYTSTDTNVFFKLYRTYYDSRVEPPKINFYRTDIQSLEEHICDAFDVDINPNGTVLGTWFVDNVPQGTGTFTGTQRQSFTQNLTSEVYGRTLYVAYNGTGFKHYKTWYHIRPEPDRWSFFVTDRQSDLEEIWDAIEVDMNCLGTSVLGTFILDGTPLTTFTLTGIERQSTPITLPHESYGRTARVIYQSAGGHFKHYKTYYSSRREPDRITSYVSNKVSTDEHEWKVFKPELNPLGGAVLCTAFIEGVAVGTYTATGSLRQQYTFSLPIQTFGRTVWAEYNSTSRFKHYYPAGLNPMVRDIEFEGDKEPPRVTIYRTGPMPYPSSQYLKTWLPMLDPAPITPGQANYIGTVTGTLIVDDTVLCTATFNGQKRQLFTIGLDLDASNAISTGSRWEAIYSGTKFKHYDTKVEVEAKPFGKDSWAYSYRKIGGASQLDMARFWSIEAESQGPQTISYFWDVNGTTISTGTITLTGGVQWIDRIPFPPNSRGYIFLFRATSLPGIPFRQGAPFKVYRVNIDLDQEGIKGLVRRDVPGTPQSGAPNA